MADILKRTVRARVHIVKNELTRYDQEHLTSEVVCTEFAQHRVVLAADMADPSEIDMSNLAEAAVVMIETDRAVTLYLNQAGPTFTNGIEIRDNGLFLLVGPVTSVHVQNTNANYTATLEFVACD